MPVSLFSLPGHSTRRPLQVDLPQKLFLLIIEIGFCLAFADIHMGNYLVVY